MRSSLASGLLRLVDHTFHRHKPTGGACASARHPISFLLHGGPESGLWPPYPGVRVPSLHLASAISPHTPDRTVQAPPRLLVSGMTASEVHVLLRHTPSGL